jgi:D-alanyl-D-alanine carboxypeptidase
MLISAGQDCTDCARAAHRSRSSVTSYLARALIVLLVVSVAATSAEAKKHRIVRHAYSPPQSAMVLDANSGKILHANNIDALRYPASITKVMTLYLVFEQLRAGTIKPDTELSVSAKAAGQAPSKLELASGTTITVQNAVYALVTKSANDVAVVFAENIGGTEEEFAHLMTAKAHALGMRNTTFHNASGLPNPGQMTTAHDLIIMAQHILADFPEYSSVFQTRAFTYNGETHRNHNSLLFSYPGMEGLKTGFTQLSGFNLLASARRGDKHLLAVVLGGSSARDRNNRVRNLLDASWSKATATKSKGQNFVVASATGSATKPEVAKEEKVVQTKTAALSDNYIITSEDLPERNPALHSTIDEQVLAVTLASNERQTEKPTPAARTQIALASDAVAPEKKAPQPQQNAVVINASESVSPPRTKIATKTTTVAAANIATGNITTANTTATTNATPVTVAAPASANTKSEPESDKKIDAQASIQPKAKPEVSKKTEVSKNDASAAATSANNAGPFQIQVGSYLNEEGAKDQLQTIHAKARDVLNGHGQLTVSSNVQGKAYYRARFGRFSEAEAKDTCVKLKSLKVDCLVVRAE